MKDRVEKMWFSEEPPDVTVELCKLRSAWIRKEREAAESAHIRATLEAAYRELESGGKDKPPKPPWQRWKDWGKKVLAGTEKAHKVAKILEWIWEHASQLFSRPRQPAAAGQV